MDAYHERYARQLSLPGFGEAGQRALREGSVLVIGAGGLGCPALQCLAAAGVGRIGIVDDDVISLSNLQRQVLYTTDTVGQPKAEVAATVLARLNPDCRYEPRATAVSRENALELLSDYDVIIDGTDNFAARYLINDACVLLGKPLVYGSVHRFEGQVAVFNYQGSAHYRDLFPEPPPAGQVPDCAQAGVLGVLPAIIGSMQAAEAIKVLTGMGTPLKNRLLSYDLLQQEWTPFSFSASGRKSGPGNVIEFRHWNDSSERASSAGHELRNIEGAAFRELLEGGNCVVIDVREAGEKPDAAGFDYLHIPMNELPARAADFHHQTIVLFCHSGIRSAVAAGYFPEDNRLYHLKGGIVKWLHYLSTLPHVRTPH